ncbi:MAG TPA: hypothetical protein VLI05_02095 [Candidatus Saccharimonadia bacterium]|nr:hypothetical protein [Candidatus Saccharimonadia bacterium]
MSRWSNLRDGAKRRLEALKHPAPGADPDNKSLWAKLFVRLFVLTAVVCVTWLVLGGIMTHLVLAAHDEQQVSIDSPALLSSVPAWGWMLFAAGLVLAGIFEYRLKRHTGVEKPLRAARFWFFAAGGVLLLWIFSGMGISVSPWLIAVVGLICLAAWLFAPARHRINLGWTALLSASLLSLSLVHAPNATPQPVTQVETNSCAAGDAKACQLLGTDLSNNVQAFGGALKEVCGTAVVTSKVKEACDKYTPQLDTWSKTVKSDAEAMVQGAQHNAATPTTTPPPTK